MRATPPRSLQSIAWLSLAMLAVGLTGCSAFKLPALPAFSLGQSSTNYVGLESGYEAEPSSSEDIYNKVRQARAENSIVLQVVGEDPPTRILPLPPGEKSVFVSDLLKQTGVQQKLGAVDATLFRYAQGTIGGIRMAVKMSPDKRVVRPESDYALRPGDRLRVEKAANPGLQKLLEMAIGL